MAISTEPSFFTVLWDQKLLVLGIVIVAAAIGFGLAMIQPETYEAEATVLITDPNTAQELTDQMGLERSAHRNTTTQAAFMETIEPSISTSVEKDTGIITIEASSSAAAEAVRTIESMFAEYSSTMQLSADTAAAELIAQLDEQEAAAEAEVVEAGAAFSATPDNVALRDAQINAIGQLRLVDRNRTKIENQHETYGNGVQFYEEPQSPGASSGWSPISAAIAAAALGLLVATGVAWVRGS